MQIWFGKDEGIQVGSRRPSARRLGEERECSRLENIIFILNEALEMVQRGILDAGGLSGEV